MKPENFNKKSIKSISRVKTLIKSRLHWLSGFPMVVNKKLVWIYTDSSFYHDQIIEIGSKTISKSQRTINTLFRDYPVALPSVVGDAKQWHERCIAYIQHAKELINTNPKNVHSLFETDSFYGNEYLKLLNKSQRQSELLTALSWKNYLNRSDLKPSLQFFNQFQTNNYHFELPSLVNLATLYGKHKDKSIGLVELFLLIHKVNSTTSAKHEFFTPYLKFKTAKAIKKHKKNFNPEKFPVNKDKQKLDGFLQQVSNLKLPQRNRCLMLVESLKIDGKFHDWDQWWSRISFPCEKITNHIRLGQSENTDEILLLQHQINTLFKQKPTDFCLESLFNSIILFSNQKESCPILIKLIQLLNDEKSTYPLCDEFLNYFYHLLKYAEPKSKIFKSYLTGLLSFLKLPSSSIDDQGPWQSIPGSIWGNVDAELLDEASTQQINTFFAAIIKIKKASPESLKTKNLSGIFNLVKNGFAPEVVAEFNSKLHESKAFEDFPETVAKISFECGLTINETIEVLDVWNTLFNNAAYFDGLEAIYEIFKSIKQQQFFKRLLLKHDRKQLLSDSFHIRVIAKISGPDAIPLPCSINPQHADWINSYPTMFHPILEHLNRLNDSIQNKVKSIFRSTWWPKDFIDFEIQNLTNTIQLNDKNIAAINKRIEKLKNQLINHQPITDHKTKKITKKLESLFDRTYFENWQEKLRKQFEIDWLALFNIEREQTPEWLTSSYYVDKLLPILDFNKSSKNMAIKVIRARCFGNYYYLMDEIENNKFVKRLVDEGIQMDKWPHQLGEYSYEAINGENIIISIESDPLESLEMGGHFGTCLSPGDFNYFSVFTNIADVNKQVIYARNEKNKVVGRVLIGVTNQGVLQVFYKYSHHKDYQFTQHVMGYVSQIVEQTGLILSNHGKVDPLCCNQWYDDGATAIDLSFPCLKEESTFRTNIPSMSEKDFIPQLTEAMKPMQVNALVFPSLLKISEIKDNPKLFSCLMKLSVSIKNLPISDILALYNLADETGLESSCYQLHRKRIFKYLLSQIDSYYWHDDQYIVRIAQHHPSDALRIIKAQAKAFNVDWKKDLIRSSRKAAYIALKKLGRDQLAEIYEQVSD